MSEFDEAVDLVLKQEGGYSNDLDDPGGETNLGITKRDHPEVNIKDLTRAQAEAIYYSDYWNPQHYNSLPQYIANRVFSLAVNIGPVPATRLLQQALGHLVAGPIVAGSLGGKPGVHRLYPQGAVRELPRVWKIGRGSGFNGGTFQAAGRVAPGAHQIQSEGA